jgi:hypothetical protein
LKWRLGGLEIWSRHFGGEKSPLALLEIEWLKYVTNVITLIMVVVYILQYGGETGH